MITFRITIKQMLILVVCQLGICRGLVKGEEFRIGQLSVHETNMFGSVNFAFGTTVTPHSNIMQGHPTNIVDGKWNTVWWSFQSHQGNLIDFTFDLEREVNIGQLLYRPGQTESYSIETSIDGNAWTERHADDIEYIPHSIITQAVNGVYSARYFRYRGRNNRNAYVGMFDFQVYKLTHTPPSWSSLSKAKPIVITPCKHAAICKPGVGLMPLPTLK